MTIYPPASPVYGWPLLEGGANNDWRQIDLAFLAVEQSVQAVDARVLTVAAADLRYLGLGGGALSGPLALPAVVFEETTLRRRAAGVLEVDGVALLTTATGDARYYTQVQSDSRYRLASVPTADSALRAYVQRIMAVLDPGGPPPPPP